MVEFGLKLQDNKVAEWDEYYIDYEKLKLILDKLKDAVKKKDKVFEEKSEIAHAIQIEWAASTDQNFEDATSQTLYGSSKSLDENVSSNVVLDNPEVVRRKSNSQSEQRDIFPKTDSFVSLLQGASSITHYGSEGSLNSLRKYRSPDRYAIRVKDVLKKIKIQENNFDKQLHLELEKVTLFYVTKAKELSKKLKVLLESVGISDESEENLYFTQYNLKKKKDIRKSLISFWQRKIGDAANNDSIGSNASGDGTGRIFLSGRSFDDELEKIESYRQENPDTARSIMSEKGCNEIESIQREQLDQYRSIKLLKNFAIMNYTGFIKILKKFKKIDPEQKKKYDDFQKQLNIFNEIREAEILEGKHEKIYANWFCDGNVVEARAQLLPKRGDGLQMDWSQLRLGYRLGMCAILTLWVCWDCVWGFVRDGDTTIGGRNAFPVFRACGGLLFLHWFWGASVYVWTRYRINYIFLFDLNPNNVNDPISIFNDAVDESLVFLVCMLLYYKAGADAIPQLIPTEGYPTFLLLYTCMCLIFPLRTRIPMWKAIFEVITAPMVSPTFFTIYIADVFTSMVKVFQDIAWSFGFLLSGDFLASEGDKDYGIHEWQHSFWYKNVLIPFICLLPLWFRFCQCLRKYVDTGKRMPNIANAGKYAMSQTVTLFGAFHPLYLMHERSTANRINWFRIFWLFLFISSSLYSFWWDVFKDWGLGNTQHGFLAPRLMYPRRSYYYAVIVVDIVLRFMWVLTLLPPQSGLKFELPQYLTFVTMSLELLRRTVWGFFRLENEHRSNTNHYRRVKFVPLHFNTGHQHKYGQGKERIGSSVMVEVLIVSLFVIAVSVSSVIAAQKATHSLRDDEI